MELSTWLSLALICILGAMSPGPSLAVVLKHSLHNSAAHGIVASLSHGFGVGVYAALSLLGLAGLVNRYPILFQIMVFGGAMYLAFMGIKILTSKTGSLSVESPSATSDYGKAARDGFAIAFLNPKLAIFFLALFSQFIVPENMTLQSAFIMCSTVLIIDTVWYFAVSVLSVKARDKFSFISKRGIIDKVLGWMFLLLALRVVIEQLQHI